MVASGENKLGDFIIQLSKDPMLVDKLKTDPAATMEASGLSDADKKVVLSGDPVAIRKAVTGHPLIPNETVVVVVVVVVVG